MGWMRRNGSPNAAGEVTKGRRESRARRLPDVETLSFEDAQAELDSVVATLEAGESISTAHWFYMSVASRWRGTVRRCSTPPRCASSASVCQETNQLKRIGQAPMSRRQPTNEPGEGALSGGPGGDPVTKA